MRRPTIIAVNRFYAPDHSATAQLLTDLCEHLAAPVGDRVGGRVADRAGDRLGGQDGRAAQPVTVVTSRLNYDDPTATLPARETINGVRVRRVWTTRFGRAGLWGRAVDYLSFYLSATLALLQEARPGDTILAKTDPPLMSIPAAMVCRLRRARLVNWCQDLFPEVAAAVGLGWAGGPLGRILMALRDRSLRRADLNVVLNQPMRAHLLAHAVPDSRIRVIHNWPDASLAPTPRPRTGHCPAAGDDRPEPFIICYSGNLGRVHNVAAIIELIERTADLPALHFRIVGGGVAQARLKDAMAERGWSHIRFEPYAPRHGLNESLGACDAHLITLDPACEGLIQPSKIYGILACGRPAIFIGARTGGIARLLDRHAAGPGGLARVPEADGRARVPEACGLARVPEAGGLDEEGVAGLVLDIRQPETWRPAIAGLVQDPAQLARMGEAAHAAYRRCYTQAHAFAAWRDVLLPAPAGLPVASPELVPARITGPAPAGAYAPAPAHAGKRTAA